MSQDCEQPKICEQKFIRIEGQIQEVNHRLDCFDGVLEILAELKQIYRQVAEDNKERDALLKERDILLREQGNSLIQMTASLQNLNEKMERIEQTNISKWEKTEQKIEELVSNSKLNVLEIAKYIFFLILGGFLIKILPFLPLNL